MARASEMVVGCVTDSPQVNEVLFGPGALAEGFAPGSLLIDCSTISPASARDFGRASKSVGSPWSMPPSLAAPKALWRGL